MKTKLTFHFIALILGLHELVLTFESVDEILKCTHSNESYLVVLSGGTVYYAVQEESNFNLSLGSLKNMETFPISSYFRVCTVYFRVSYYSVYYICI